MKKIFFCIPLLAACLHLPAAPFAVIDNNKGSGAIVIPDKAVDVEKLVKDIVFDIFAVINIGEIDTGFLRRTEETLFFPAE